MTAPSLPLPTNAIVLFAHGSRDPLWHQPMERIAQKITIAAPLTPVVCAYLELSTPSLSVATQSLVDQGVMAITVVPLFLGVGKHAREDLPVLMQELADQHRSVAFTLKPAVGEDARLIDLLAKIALEGSSNLL
jgi:sirohydrochlorin cobaltochelatase